VDERADWRVLSGELAARGVPLAGMRLTRLQATMVLSNGMAVWYCTGWLLWQTGRSSRRGRPLFTLHRSDDPAGAARRLAATPR
jgi:hypothetical protein